MAAKLDYFFHFLINIRNMCLYGILGVFLRKNHFIFKGILEWGHGMIRTPDFISHKNYRPNTVCVVSEKHALSPEERSIRERDGFHISLFL